MKHLIALCLVIATLPVSAAVPVDQAFELCRAEQNALRRLTCYDAINISSVVSAKSDSTTKVTAAHVTPAVPAKAVQPKESAADFGMEHRNAEDAPDQVYMTVKAVRYTPRKELVVEFDNGQVWRQIDSGYYKIESGQQHYVKRGVLNSFFLGNDAGNRTVRVRREK